jgi:hypothetical protein
MGTLGRASHEMEWMTLRSDHSDHERQLGVVHSRELFQGEERTSRDLAPLDSVP